jgi:8-amino-7-oxononanoate synthase
VIDELAHACLWTGARLTRGKALSFRHNDVAHAESLLAENRRKHPRAMIATDGVFSMDGDLAPLADLAALARRFDAWLISDDAHGVGVIGGGRGSSFADGAKADVDLQMGTLSKAIGAYGGYLCASRPVIDLIRNRARTFIYSTGLPPAIAAAAIAALDVIESEPETIARPVAKAKAFTRRLGLPEAQSTIVPVILGDEERAMRAAKLLENESFLVVAIRPPTVPAGTARLRLTFSAAHPDAEIERLADIIRTQILAR